MTVTAEDVGRVARALRLTPGHHGTQVEAAAMLCTLLQEREEEKFHRGIVEGQRNEAKAEAYEHAADEAWKRVERCSNPHSTYNDSTGKEALQIFTCELRTLAAQARQEGSE